MLLGKVPLSDHDELGQIVSQALAHAFLNKHELRETFQQFVRESGSLCSCKGRNIFYVYCMSIFTFCECHGKLSQYICTYDVFVYLK